MNDAFFQAGDDYRKKATHTWTQGYEERHEHFTDQINKKFKRFEATSKYNMINTVQVLAKQFHEELIQFEQ
jgi:hypothetical protein